MRYTAKDVMSREFNMIEQNEPVEKAVRIILEGKARPTGYKTISTLVTDDYGNLVGVVSMFDVLYHIRPPFLNYMGENLNFGEAELLSYVKRFRGLRVGQVMNSPVRYVSADTDLMEVIDRMVKERCRRLPVLENGKIIGMVYLAEVYSHICKTWMGIDRR
ncbi:MAG: CBS domain-containing protein [Desulfobacterales bacterium]